MFLGSKHINATAKEKNVWQWLDRHPKFSQK